MDSIRESESVGTLGTTLRVPVALWHRLRSFATARRIPMQAVWLTSLKEYLDRNDPS